MAANSGNMTIGIPPKRTVSLAEVGTFTLEFGYLSDILNDQNYIEKARQIIERLSEMKTSLPGLYPAYINSDEENQSDDYYTFGGLADSFYEYLLKYWLYTGKRDKLHHSMYKKAVDGMKRHLLQKRNGHIFIANRKGNTIIDEQEHLACFLPGTLALGAIEENDKDTLVLAEELAESCYLMYHRQRSGLSPENININNFRPILHKTYWIMRPEVVESLFYLWRATHNVKYRRWGYEIAQNIERHAKIESGGYVGIDNVLVKPFKYNDRQESFFLAETLKYLYLLFCDDDILPLDKWVFNTEAHPFPINWRGIAYSSTDQAASSAPLKENLGEEGGKKETVIRGTVDPREVEQVREQMQQELDKQTKLVVAVEDKDQDIAMEQ